MLRRAFPDIVFTEPWKLRREETAVVAVVNSASSRKATAAVEKQEEVVEEERGHDDDKASSTEGGDDEAEGGAGVQNGRVLVRAIDKIIMYASPPSAPAPYTRPLYTCSCPQLLFILNIFLFHSHLFMSTPGTRCMTLCTASAA